MTPRKKAVLLVGLAALALVVAFAALLSTFARPARNITVAAAATATVTITPTQSATWKTGALIASGDQVFAIALAASEPDVGFACVGRRNGASNYDYIISVTHDGGATWKPSNPIPGGGGSCLLAINPTDARDVTLGVIPMASGGYTLYRSRDGGATFAELPTLPNQERNSYMLSRIGWAGTTLFVALQTSDGADRITRIFTAPAGKPLTERTTGGRLGDVKLLTPQFVGGTTDTLFAAFGENPFAQKSVQLLKSTDGGITWATAKLGNSTTLFPLGNSLTGNIIVATDLTKTGSSLISRDGGTTFLPLPPLADSQGVNPLALTVRGDLFAIAGQSPGYYYFLPANATIWMELFQVSTTATLVPVVKLDATGAPVALWNFTSSNGNLMLLTLDLHQ